MMYSMQLTRMYVINACIRDFVAICGQIFTSPVNRLKMKGGRLTFSYYEVIHIQSAVKDTKSLTYNHTVIPVEMYIHSPFVFCVMCNK